MSCLSHVEAVLVDELDLHLQPIVPSALRYLALDAISQITCEGDARTNRGELFLVTAADYGRRFTHGSPPCLKPYASSHESVKPGARTIVVMSGVDRGPKDVSASQRVMECS